MADYLTDLWQVLLDLSPSLLLGLTIAGLIHVYLPVGLIRRGLSRADLASVTRASLLGVPMPLCSCGVIPTALGLYRDGASRGATTAFMVSTPQIGADSILVSASFLGWPFALFKVAAAWVTGLLAGVLVNRLDAPPASPDADPGTGPALATGNDPAGTPTAPTGHRAEGLPGALRYAVVDLLGAIDLWLIGGVLLAALITTLTPPDFFAGQPWATGLTGMLVVLAIALPLYVCTTASVPIAASLISAGMPAGSALVFLMAGPATNVATIGAVYRVLGARILGIYLGTVAVMSILFGLTFDALLATPSITGDAAHHHHGVEAGIDWTGTAATLVLLALLGWLGWRRLTRQAAPGAGAIAPAVTGEATLRVKGMSCGHCVASVRQALESVPMVESAEPDLATGLVRVRGGFTETTALVHAVQAAGFQVLDQPSIPTTPPG